MAVLDFLISPYTIPVALALYFLIPYLTSNTGIRDIPGPFAAKFTNLWLLLRSRQGKRYKSVHEAHKKYGKLVRIQPNHVSVADLSAIPIIYGHGNGFLKSWVASIYTHSSFEAGELT
jgi:benzoate 4-monooxygenase